MIKPLAERIKALLLDKKLISSQDLESALKEARQNQGRLSEVLVKKGWVKEENLISLLASELGLPVINLKRLRPDSTLLSLISEAYCRRYHLLPISKIGQTLTLAMSDPLDVLALDMIKILTGYQLKPILANPSELAEAISRFYSEPTEIKDILKTIKSEEMELLGLEEVISSTKLREESEDAPIVKFVNLLLVRALKLRASDIHIEPYENRFRVRYRIDGVLHEIISPPKKMQAAVLARLKIMSGLDITEKRTPQDGRFRATISGKAIDYRVSALPITYGEKIVLRALDRSSLSIGLDELGFSAKPLQRFEEAVSRSYGMILVTGPTGSGKSTTLYSILNRLNTYERNIITIEDPVEYEIEGLTQIQVRPEIKFSFAEGLRAILRQSPDIIMVGEIRDGETANIAIKASLTGELLFSTLHTNDAPSAITRLMDMGVEPFLVASALIMVEAQRLIRKLCRHCRASIPVTKELKQKFGLKTDSIYRAAGCSYCNNTGYLGRIAIVEVFLVNDAIRGLISLKADADKIRQAARQDGMRTLREDGLAKVEEGITSLEEVLRVS